MTNQNQHFYYATSTEHIRNAVKQKYGASISEKLAEYLLQTVDILGQAANIRGVSSIMNFDYILCPYAYSLLHTLKNALWYKSMRRDGNSRIAVDNANIKRIFAEKDHAVMLAKELHLSAQSEIRRIQQPELKKDCREFFLNFSDLAEYLSVSRKRLWVQLKIVKEKAGWEWMKTLDSLLAEEKNCRQHQL